MTALRVAKERPTNNECGSVVLALREATLQRRASVLDL